MAASVSRAGVREGALVAVIAAGHGDSASSIRSGRTGRSGRLVLWVTASFLIFLAILEGYRFTLPTDGWSLLPPVEAPVFGVDLLGAETPLLAGDRLVAVDGLPFPLLVAEAVRLRRVDLNYAVGDVKTYTVERDGAEVDVAVPLGRWTVAGILRALWRTLVNTQVGGVYRWLAWLLAAFVFARRPDLTSARLFFLLESVMLGAAITSTVAQVSVADVLSPARFYAARFTGDLFTWLLVPPLGLHVILAFPGSRTAPRAALVLNYLAPWLVLAAVWIGAPPLLVPVMASAYTLLSMAAVVHLVVRHGSGAQRARVRWFAFAFGVSNLVSAMFWFENVGLLPRLPALNAVLFDHCLCDLVYVAGFAVAILWHGLFDVDVVVGRTLVYGALTIAAVAVYAVLVGGVGSLLSVESSLALSVVTTVVVAFAFDPLRVRLQRASNRLLYGFRDEPYEVLSRLGERLRSAPQLGTVLGDVTRAVAESLRLPFAAVTLGSVTATRYGEPQPVRETFPLRHAGKRLGELIVSPRQAEARLSRADRKLLDSLAAHVGTVAHALLLEADLERARLESLNVRESERRRLGSDLHDDVGHRLTWLMLQAQDASMLVDRSPAAAKATLAALAEEVKATLTRVRALAHQLHPPELATLGLVGAIQERLQASHGSSGIRFLLAADDLGAVPAGVELAAYHIVLEALSNVVKHVGQGTCRIRLRVTSGPTDPVLAGLAERFLEIEVRDDGPARTDWGADLPPQGLGFRSMQGRVREVGGTLVIDQPSDGGTRVCATLPWPE